MSIVALRDLHPGEEILVRVAVSRLLQKKLNLSWIFQIQLQMQVCYNYKLDKAPQWYQNNWIHHLMWGIFGKIRDCLKLQTRKSQVLMAMDFAVVVKRNSCQIQEGSGMESWRCDNLWDQSGNQVLDTCFFLLYFLLLALLENYSLLPLVVTFFPPATRFMHPWRRRTERTEEGTED